MMHQYQFEGDQAAISVHVAVAGGAQHGAFVVDVSFVELRWERHTALAAGDGVPHHGLGPRAVDEEGEAVAAAEEAQVVVAAPRQGEARAGDAVGPAQRGHELDVAVFIGEESEEWRRPVVGAEAAEEPGVGDEAAPAPADRGGARERGRQRREAEQDLAEEVVVVQRGGAGRRVALRRARRRGGSLGTLRSPHQPAEAAALHLAPSSAPPSEATAAPRTALSASEDQIQIGG